jgi:hypothetical protein
MSDFVVEEHTGLVHVVGQVDVSRGLLGPPGAEDLVEVLVCSRQELADAKRGIGLAPARAECLVLHSPRDRVEHWVGHRRHMERIRHTPRMGRF